VENNILMLQASTLASIECFAVWHKYASSCTRCNIGHPLYAERDGQPDPLIFRSSSGWDLFFLTGPAEQVSSNPSTEDGNRSRFRNVIFASVL
jgi:hypothetical protein